MAAQIFVFSGNILSDKCSDILLCGFIVSADHATIINLQSIKNNSNTSSGELPITHLDLYELLKLNYPGNNSETSALFVYMMFMWSCSGKTSQDRVFTTPLTLSNANYLIYVTFKNYFGGLIPIYELSSTASVTMPDSSVNDTVFASGDILSKLVPNLVTTCPITITRADSPNEKQYTANFIIIHGTISVTYEDGSPTQEKTGYFIMVVRNTIE